MACDGDVYVNTQSSSNHTLMEKAKSLDKKNGGKPHVETMNMMVSWQKFSFQLMIRNRSDFFSKIETSHFMSKGIICRIPENFVLHELTNIWLNPECIRNIVLVGRQGLRPAYSR